MKVEWLNFADDIIEQDLEEQKNEMNMHRWIRMLHSSQKKMRIGSFIPDPLGSLNKKSTVFITQVN